MSSRRRHPSIYSGLRGPRQPVRALAALAGAAACLGLAACSITSPLTRAGDDELTTASIPAKRAAPADHLVLLDERLDPEDLRRARAALATALDPQGSGATVRWDNPDSAAKGSITAVGGPYLEGDTICRNFVAATGAQSADTWRQGRACRLAPGEWDIRELRPWRQPG